MRKKQPIDCLFPRIRQAILVSTVMHPQRSWYLSDLAKHIGVPPSSLHREIGQLVAAGILTRQIEGNRVYFQANQDCPFLSDLQGLLTKTVGLVEVLRETLQPLAGKIDCAFIYGSIARGEGLSASDVDLMIIGTAGLKDVAPLLKESERRLSRPVNPTVYTKEEFIKNVNSGHHFLVSVLGEKKLSILCDIDELANAFGEQQRKAPHNKQARDHKPPSRGKSRSSGRRINRSLP